MSQSHGTVKYTIKLKSSSHWVSALVPSMISGWSNNDQPRPKQIHIRWEMLHIYASLNNVPEFEIYFTEDFVSIIHYWPICHVTLHTVLFIEARKSLCFICYDSWYCHIKWHWRMFECKQSMVTTLWYFGGRSPLQNFSASNLNPMSFTGPWHHPRPWNGDEIIHMYFEP